MNDVQKYRDIVIEYWQKLPDEIRESLVANWSKRWDKEDDHKSMFELIMACTLYMKVNAINCWFQAWFLLDFNDCKARFDTNFDSLHLLSVEFRELSHLTRDIYQAEKKINVITSWANAQNDIHFTQNGWSYHFEQK